jgi:hypothetical protein
MRATSTQSPLAKLSELLTQRRPQPAALASDVMSSTIPTPLVGALPGLGGAERSHTRRTLQCWAAALQTR